MKIYRDIHGLFLRTDGRIYRPVRSLSSYMIRHAVNSKEDGSSAFAEGLRLTVGIDHKLLFVL